MPHHARPAVDSGPSIITDGLVLYYPFSGTSDLSGNGLTGTLNGNASVSGNELILPDGVSDYIATPANFGATYLASLPLSIVCDIYVNAISFAGLVSSCGTAVNYAGATLTLYGDGTIVVQSGSNACATSSCRRTVVSTSTVSTGTWISLVAAFTAMSTSGINLYINGSAVSTTNSGTATVFAQTTLAGRVGCPQRTSDTTSLNGKIRNVRFYNRALSAAEAASIAAGTG